MTTALDEPPDLRGPDVTAAFAELSDTHARRLRGYLAGRVGESAADDLVAETFLVALKRRHSYDPERAPVKGWLYGIATDRPPAPGQYRYTATHQWTSVGTVFAAPADQPTAPPTDYTWLRESRHEKWIPQDLSQDWTERRTPLEGLEWLGGTVP
ncbi:RNA polymerase sigma factor [Saccharothrix sp. BKS2]|uniref:RNA polymerase sigma factor n=1 Tax=Saccharothrix sp. BKS2 TaxID=3064400 RepID=UPI0039E8D5C1